MTDLSYEPLLEAVSAWNGKPLVAFPGLRGKHYDGELVIVGRAVNGWRTSIPADDLRDPNSRGAHARRLLDEAITTDECPLKWVMEKVGRYNPASSAFWRVARKVRRELVGHPEPDWASRLAWTNLYLVAPEAGRNPPASLIRAQRNESMVLLRRFIASAAPRRLLFATGAGWFTHFADALGFEPADELSGTYVELAGRLGDAGIPTVIAQHPERKPESPWVTEVIAAFHRLGA